MNKKTVLLVDDEPRLLESTAKLLQDHFNIIKSSNGRQAWECVERERLDCIVLDIVMPEMNGVEFLKRLRDKGKNIPVIIVTGISKEVDFKNMLYRASTGKIRPDGHLVKPVTADDLLEAMRKVLYESPVSDFKAAL